MHFLIICIALFLFLTSFLMLFYFCFFLNLLSFFDVFHPVVFRAQPKYLIHLYIAFSFVTEEILYSRVYAAPTSPLTISISSVLFFMGDIRNEEYLFLHHLQLRHDFIPIPISHCPFFTYFFYCQI